MSQQGLDFRKKIPNKKKYFCDLTFADVHMSRPKRPKSDNFQSKSLQIFLLFFSFFEEYQLKSRFFVIDNF